MTSPPLCRQVVRIIGDQADHMNALVSDLLDVARIETGTLPVGPEPAEVAVLVDRARSGFANGEEYNSYDISRTCPWSWRTGGASSRCFPTAVQRGPQSPESSVIRVRRRWSSRGDLGGR